VTNVTLYLDLPGPTGKLDRLLSEFGAVALPGPPGGLEEVPPGKALICVADMGAYEAPGYIITEIELATWTGPADTSPKTWLLMDRQMADRLCPGAAEDRSPGSRAWSVTPKLPRILTTSSRWRGQAAARRRAAALVRGGPAR
jgi:hypothetical protein